MEQGSMDAPYENDVHKVRMMVMMMKDKKKMMQKTGLMNFI